MELRLRLSSPAWPALIFLNAYLVSPLVVNELSRLLLSDQLDKLLPFSTTISLLGLLTLHAWVKSPLRLHLAMMPLYLAAGFDLYLLLHYGTRLSSSSISVMLDNQEHAGPFIREQAYSIFVPLALGTALYALGLTQLRHLRIEVTRKWRWALTLALASAYGLACAKQMHLHGARKGLLDVASHDRSSPFGVLSQGAIALLVFLESHEHEQNLAHFRFGAHRVGPADARVVVLVLGESSRPDHWSLYGYARDTTPRLRSREDLIAYDDVTAEAALTKLSVPLIITRADADTQDMLQRERSIISAFREAGYRTAWLSTQQRDQWTGAINRYTSEADHQRFFERRHDGVLLREVQSWLAAPEQDGKPAFIVLHTQGSHFTFSDRYPKAFERFSGASDPRQQLIDTYDNSIGYVDFVLDSLIRILEADGRHAALIYAADHGENLYDDSRNLFGHFFGNDKDIPIPMLLWLSPSLAAAEPERIRAARSQRSARLSTAALFHTLLDLGTIAIEGDPGAATRSLLQPTFRERPRLFVTSNWEVVDFDQVYPGARTGPSASLRSEPPRAGVGHSVATLH